MSAQDLQQFISLVQTQIGIQDDQNLRKQGEQELSKIRSNNPNSFILCYLNILKEHQEMSFRQFAGSQIRKNLSLYSEGSFVYIWGQLSQETKNTFKAEIFNILQNEQNHKVKKIICEAIGEIGASLQEEFNSQEGGEQKPHEWEGLIDTLWSMFSQDNDSILESAFLIMNAIISFLPELFDKHQTNLYTLFQNGIQKENLQIKSASIQCLCSYIQVSDSKMTKDFDSLLQYMLQGIQQLLEKDIILGEEGMDALEQIAEYEPKFFRKYFNYLFEFGDYLNKMQDLDKAIKQQAVDIIIEVIEKVPKVINKDAQLQQNLCNLIFLLMVESDTDISEEWKRPKEGFNDDNEDDEEDSTKFGINCVDRFISSIGEKNALSVIGNTVQQLLKPESAWRHQYAAIMALSQVGEYVDDIELISQTIMLITGYFDHENPKIRYAVCHAIGQIADDMKPDFQQKYHKDILPKLITVCEDQVPRVSSHAFAAITNFVESIDKELIKDSLDPILKVSFQALQSGISIQKENAVSTIAASAEASKDYFVPYFQEAMPVLFQVYNNHVNKEYRQLRGQTIECITLIAHGVPKEIFMPYLEQIITILIQLQESQFEQVDPQKSYVLSGWQRLCLLFSNELIPYMEKIIPGLFNLVQTVFRSEAEGDDNNANTYDKDETDIAIHMLAVFINQLKENFKPFVQQTTDLIVPLCGYSKSVNIRVSAAKCLSCLIACTKNQQQPQIAQGICKNFIEILYKAMQTEYDTEVIVSQAMSIKECLDEIDGPCYDEKELQEFSQQLFQVLFDSDNRKAANDRCKDDQDLEDDEKEQLDEENELEEDLHVAIAEIIGQLFRTHQDSCISIAQLIYKTILPKVLDASLSYKMHKFGIFLICDMIEYLPYAKLTDIWFNLLEALIKFSAEKNLQVRQASIYGIGIYSVKTTPEVFAGQTKDILTALSNALQLTKANKEQYKEKFNNKCIDNIISAFGKIIKHQHANVNIQEQINEWVQYLPLKFDRKEALINHYLLTQIAIEQPALLFQNQNNIGQVISIYSQIIGSKLETPKLSEKIKISLQALSQEQYVKDNWDNLINGLSDLQKTKLQKFMSQ